MSKVTAPILATAFQLSKESQPKALAAKILFKGQHGDPVRYVQVNGVIDLEDIANRLNRMLALDGEA